MNKDSIRAMIRSRVQLETRAHAVGIVDHAELDKGDAELSRAVLAKLAPKIKTDALPISAMRALIASLPNAAPATKTDNQPNPWAVPVVKENKTDAVEAALSGYLKDQGI